MGSGMRPRFHIVVSSKQVRGSPSQASPLSFWGRFKLLLAGLTLAVLAVAVLIAAFILGSVIAAVLAVLLVIAIAAVIVKTALMRGRHSKRQAQKNLI